MLLPVIALTGAGWYAWRWTTPVVEPVGLSQAAIVPPAPPPGWWHMMALPALVGVAGLIAVAALALRAVQQARRAAAAHAALEAETNRRLLAEEALRHAQKMEAVGRLTGGIAHDFNNHLTVISSNVELLKRRLPNTAPDVQRFADAAMQGVRRAATLTQRLLAFSRQQTPDPEPLDAAQVMAGMLDLLRRTLGEKIAVETTSTGSLWLTHVDSNQLESAVLNLAVNARDAMPGGGRLTIETANATLEESDGAVRAGQYVMIAVRDTGTGMAGDLQVRALEPFFTTKPVGEGTGLGLSMVQGFVRQVGGHLRIDSEPGAGTAVRMYLPRYVQPAPAADFSPALSHHTGDGRTVLVVEDDDTVRNASVEALREIGYHVLEAPDAMEAVRLLADRGGIDLLFTDVGLPGGVNGRALADAARNINPALKVLFTTGYRRDALDACGFSQEEEQFLAKPFTLQQLETKVRDALVAPADAQVEQLPTASV